MLKLKRMKALVLSFIRELRPVNMKMKAEVHQKKALFADTLEPFPDLRPTHMVSKTRPYTQRI